VALDAGTLTELVLGAGGLAAAYIVPIVLTRRKDAGDEKHDAVSSWAELNEALQTEIRRVTGELERQRADYQRQLDGLRGDYQAQLDGARGRITELEAEVATLQRALRGLGP
jgi:chromosome segregation ATPase